MRQSTSFRGAFSRLKGEISLATCTVSDLSGKIDSLQVLDQAIEAARTFKPMTKEEIAALLGRTRKAAEKGQYELYKISQYFDGTAKHPQWLG